MDVDEAVMLTLGIIGWFTVTVSKPEVTITGLAQRAFELIVQ